MQAIILFDLTFGDAGKGSLIDYLARAHNAHTVIRFNGGAQAAHTVVLPDGRTHTFSQFSSATFIKGVRTHLSRFVLFDPAALLGEENHLQTVGVTDAFQRLSIDRDAPVVTPFHKAANRLREVSRGNARHGSCGMGIGETMADLTEDPATALRAADLPDKTVTRQKLAHFQEKKRAEISKLVLPDTADTRDTLTRELALLNDPRAPEEFAFLFQNVINQITLTPSAAHIFHQPGTILFEAAQGVLLDEWYGFHPHTTWSTTTPQNARTLLAEHNYPGTVTTIAAARAYLTRHGTGPFPTESAAFTAQLQDPHNPTNPWQHHFRTGPLDLVLLRYALDVAQKSGPIDALALTCLDRLTHLQRNPVATHYTNIPASLYTPTARIPTRLDISPTPDLPYQEQLTNALLLAQPAYTEILPIHLLPWLEDRLSLPITLTSHGPTHLDKSPRPRSIRRPTITTFPATLTA